MNVQDAPERSPLVFGSRLTASYEHVGAGIVEVDPEGRVLRVNQQFCELTGFSRSELLGRIIFQITLPEDIDQDRVQFNRQAAGEIDRYTVEKRIRRKDGGHFWAEMTSLGVRDAAGKFLYAVRVQHDITARKQAEQALERRTEEQAATQRRLEDSERQLQALLAAIPAAIYTTDAEGRITYFNQAAVELAGRIPTIGSDEWCVTWRLFNPDGTPVPHDQSPMAIALREGRAIRNAEAIAERPDGTRVPLIPYPTPLRDASGRIVGAINMLADISERKQAETQQRLLLDELNHRTKNNMQMLVSLLSSAARKVSSEEAKRALGETCGRIAAMAAAQRVLYGRADANHFDADEFLNAVCQTIRQTLSPEIRIICKPATGAMSNEVAMPLALIMNELVTNAVKHGVRDRSKHSVRVSLTECDSQLCLSVEDDGEGFDLDAVRRTSSGLQLVSGLSRQLQGSFEVTRNPSMACVRFAASRSS
jgi:PAS domain S-box-containing protein